MITKEDIKKIQPKLDLHKETYWIDKIIAGAYYEYERVYYQKDKTGKTSISEQDLVKLIRKIMIKIKEIEYHNNMIKDNFRKDYILKE